MATTEARSDTTECRMLKRVREELIDHGRWVRQKLFEGHISGERQKTEWNVEDQSYELSDEYTAFEDFEWRPEDESRAILAGRIYTDPQTPTEVVESLMAPPDGYDDDDASKVRGVKVVDFKACLVGGILFAAGAEGLDSRESPEFIQVMVATGRAALRMAREREGVPPLSAEEMAVAMPYSHEGSMHAQDVIIGVNDDPATTSEHIDQLIAWADVELACIRGEQEVTA